VGFAVSWTPGTAWREDSAGGAAAMLDITDQLVAARGRGEWNAKSITTLGGPGRPDELRVEWDDGDDWMRILHTSTVLALAWVHGPLVVTTLGHADLVDEIVVVTGT